VSEPGARSLVIPPLSVRTDDGRTFRFTRPFTIGRESQCDVRIDDAHVSRKHVVVSFGNGRWVFRDQHSGNGVLVEGRRVGSGAIDDELTVQLGSGGPSLVMTLAPVQAPPVREDVPDFSQTRIVQKYFQPSNSGQENASPQTMMIRKAYEQVRKKQTRGYLVLVTVVGVLAVAAGGYALYTYRQLQNQRAIALDLFYQMKILDVDLANVERRVASSGGPQDRDLVATYLARRRQMRVAYENYVAGLKVYDHSLTPQEQLILRVTRMFGECETVAPPAYLAEVSSYIRQWQSTGSYADAVRRAQQNGYIKKIVEEFGQQDLPPQFFYLAMVESHFDETASGPPTRFGIAKGMWQFVPETAKQYGLTVGPFAALRRPDPADERHQWPKATHAAATYIKYIYSTDAQASGLLVMASYNWGENRVLKLLKTMPPNPRERNFWKVLEQHRDQVPGDTYKYVMSIVSAAVIGENPRLFGFPFDNPLGQDVP
jgi:membrane-bound lytic murein transglycosylase D